MINRIIILIFLVAVFYGCGNKYSVPKDKTVFRYNESAGITSLDPAFAKDQANIWVCNQLYNGLVQMNDILEVQPCIAKSWDISEDGKTYTFYLRDDVFFHDHEIFPAGKGRKVTAHDFEYSFKRLVDDKTASPGSWVFKQVEQDTAYCFYAINDSTFRVKLKNPFSPFLGILTMQYCSVIPWEIAEYYGKDFRKNPVGTGSFYFKMWKEGVKLVMLKNENYFEYENEQRLPYLDAIAVTFIIDKQSAFLEFVKGNLDFVSGIDPGYKDEVLTPMGELNPKYHNKFEMISQPYLNTEYLGFLMDSSNSSSPLKDKRIRQAINYGFDREKMIRYLRNNIGTPAMAGMIPEGLPAFDSSLVKGYYYNPEKAKQLLAEAGYPNGEGLPEIKLSTTSAYLDLCEFIQSQLGELGMKISIDVNPPGQLREMIAQSKLDFFRGSWIADYPDAENYLSLFYSGNFCPTGPNYTHFHDTEFDRMYELSQKTTNDSIRIDLYRKMDNLVMQQAPVVVLYYDQVLRFVSKDISGLGSNAMNLLTLKKVKKEI